MGHNSPFCTRHVMFSTVLLLFAVTSSGQPIDYDDVADLLPTEPQTTNDTLAAIVRDPVVMDAVQDAVGNGSLEGLVVKKKVLIMPATEPTKVVSQREQVLMVPMKNLEDVRKNITGTVNEENEEIEEDTLVMETDTQSFSQDEEKGSHGDENNPSDMPQHEKSDEFSETKRKPYPIKDDNNLREIPYLLSNPGQEMERPKDYHHPPPTISVPIIAFLDPAKISEDDINVPIAAVLSQPDDISSLDLLENNRDEIQQNVQDYIDRSSLSVDPDYWRLTSPPSQTSLLYEPTTMENQYARNVRSETLLPVAIPRIDIVTPLFWTSDADIDYSKDPSDMDTAAEMIFRPLFRYRQESQSRSSWNRGADYQRSPYRRYNSYNSNPRRDYRYSDYY